MKKLFDSDNPLMRFLAHVCDLILLNVLWALCSLPLITMGAATTALYAVTLKKARNEEQSIVKAFFMNFKSNFLQATVLELIVLAAAFVIYGDYFFAVTQAGEYRGLFLTVATIIALLLLILITFAFPQQAMFQNKLKKYIANSYALAFCAPGRMLLIWLIWAVPVALYLIWRELFFQQLGFLWMLCGVSALAYFSSFVYRKIFDKFIKPNHASPQTPDIPDKDEE